MRPKGGALDQGSDHQISLGVQSCVVTIESDQGFPVRRVWRRRRRPAVTCVYKVLVKPKLLNPVFCIAALKPERPTHRASALSLSRTSRKPHCQSDSLTSELTTETLGCCSLRGCSRCLFPRSKRSWFPLSCKLVVLLQRTYLYKGHNSVYELILSYDSLQ